MRINKQAQGQRVQPHSLKSYFSLLSSRRHFIINVWLNQHSRVFSVANAPSVIYYGIHCILFTEKLFNY